MPSPKGQTGGTPPRPLNAPSAPTTAAVQAGTTSPVIRARQVIVSGQNEGVYVYSGTPALGTLVASLAQDGTDQFGNAVLGGNASYVGGAGLWFANSLLGGSLYFATATTPAGPWKETAQLVVDSNGFLILNLVGDSVAGAIPQSGGSGITTVAQLVAKLEAMGLLTP